MEYLFTLRDEDIFREPEFPTPASYEKRVTVKAIVRNEAGLYGFVTNPVHDCILLAGGGAESPDLQKEVLRECDEELFCEVEVIGTIGTAHEFRNRNGVEYETACYVAKAVGEAHEDTRTDDEKKNGLYPVWLSGDEALQKMKMQEEKVRAREVAFYNTAFNIIRDLRFFEIFLSR